MDALAYVNWGRWVADCPRWPDCTASVLLEPGQETAVCPPLAGEGCGLAYRVIWPPDAGEIAAALAGRPAERNRNWHPAGLARAQATGQPRGQTPDDLRAEHAAMAEAEAAGPPGLAETLAGFGLRLSADGRTLEGLG